MSCTVRILIYATDHSTLVTVPRTIKNLLNARVLSFTFNKNVKCSFHELYPGVFFISWEIYYNKRASVYSVDRIIFTIKINIAKVMNKFLLALLTT